MLERPRPLAGTLIVVHALALIAGCAGVVVAEDSTSQDLGDVEPVSLEEHLSEGGAEDARVCANENAAVMTLLSLAVAQQRFQASSAIDTDGDGRGEYGFFGELSGALPLRAFNGVGPASGVSGDELDPPILSSAFGQVVPDGVRRRTARGDRIAHTDGLVERQGYLFKIYLPGPTGPSGTPGLGEDPAGATKANDAYRWASANCEIMWCACAWPMDAEETGNRVFFINQEGKLAGYDNRDQQYEGRAGAPLFGAAYDNALPNSMEEAVAFAVRGLAANDGNIWTHVGH